MVKFETNGDNGKQILTLPTKVSDLTPEYLAYLTDDIMIADNYSLVALCHKEKLSAFVLAGRSKKDQMNTSVIPLFVKRGYHEDNDYMSRIEVCDKLLITPTALSLALHVNSPRNTLTMGHLINAIEGDKNAHINALKLNTDVIFVEFKIIPNNEILGVYKGIKVNEFDNPFKVVKEE